MVEFPGTGLYGELVFLSMFSALCLAEEEKTEEKTETEPPTVDEDVGKSRDGSKTDDEAVQREEEAIKLDGLNVAQMKELREKAEKHTFQAEVSRMMKLIINSLYRNKEVGLTFLFLSLFTYCILKVSYTYVYMYSTCVAWLSV